MSQSGGVLIMTFISFVNFSSQTIADVLPSHNKKLIRWLSTVIIVVAGVYLANLINGVINAYWERAERRFMAVPSQMTEANTIYLNVIQFIYPFVIMLFAALF